jgi:hypothetical protein
VVADALDDPGRTGAGQDRLVTDLLDHQRYPADELAALYAQRLQEETSLDEIKTYQRGSPLPTPCVPSGAASPPRRVCFPLSAW